MIFAIILCGLYIAVVLALILYARWNYGTLESLGLTVLKPLNFILGNTFNLHSQIVHLEDVNRFRKYGSVYGVYEGREPQVHICDADLIKCIMVTDYEHFKNRREMDFGTPLLNEMSDFLPHDKWRAVRKLLTPAFTSSKLKMMSYAMEPALEDFGESIKQKILSSESSQLKFNLRQEVFTMLTGMVARCLFSIDIKDKDDSDNYFTKIAKAVVEGSGGIENPTFLKSLSYSYPFLKRFVQPLFDAKASDEFVRTFKLILDDRRKSGLQKKDFVDQVIEWMDKLDTPEFKKNGVTETTILCQVLVFFFAAQDPVSSFVSFAIQSAAKNKKIEDKIHREMEAFLEEHNGEINYDNMNELKYLQACLDEAIRMVPFDIRAERICTKDWQRNGIQIKKGVTVIIPIWAVNRNPKYFPDPDTFDPERFLSPNKEKLHPYAMSSFGFGPKNCIGMRFAKNAMLLTAAHLYKNFRFKSRSDSQNIQYYPGMQLFAFPKPTYVDIELM